MTCLLQKEKGEKRESGERGLAEEAGSHFFRERVSSFSVDFSTIRPLTVFGTRRKTALRGKGFAWVPNLKSFDKLRKVGVSPYLVLFFV